MTETNKPWYWLNKDSRKFLANSYIREGQTAEERVREIANAAEGYLGISGFADKFVDYMSRGWFSLASPVWSNYGLKRGLPISCFGVYVEDDMFAILQKAAEVGAQSKEGGGTSGYFGALRPRGTEISTGGESFGSVHYLDLFETTTNVVSQSNVRRGSFAAYLDVEHPDIKEFLTLREEGSFMQKMSFGVCIGDEWMEEMIAGDKDKRKIWAAILKKRFETGYPYIFWKDTINREKPQVYKDKDMTIWASNLCTEILLPSSDKESFVCCLSSMNLLHYDDWKNTDAVEVLTYFLDSVLTEFINKTGTDKQRGYMDATRNFAINHRALGLGVLGWHSYLQSKMIAFKSNEAKRLNGEIFSLLEKKTTKASRELATLFGEAPILKGYGLRNTTRMAIAPTTSSSAILGQVSPSIEPENSNYYTKDLAKAKISIKNPYLKEVLKQHGKDDKETWKSILETGGSVQHLDFLSENEKAVFETFGEIPQIEIILQAAQRQDYLDQGQSTNLMIHPDAPLKDVNNLMIEAYNLGIRTLYYQRSSNPSQLLTRSLLSCVSCEA